MHWCIFTFEIVNTTSVWRSCKEHEGGEVFGNQWLLGVHSLATNFVDRHPSHGMQWSRKMKFIGGDTRCGPGHDIYYMHIYIRQFNTFQKKNFINSFSGIDLTKSMLQCMAKWHCHINTSTLLYTTVQKEDIGGLTALLPW